jgi:hypothetical protein
MPDKVVLQIDFPFAQAKLAAEKQLMSRATVSEHFSALSLSLFQFQFAIIYTQRNLVPNLDTLNHLLKSI